jgi:hypothetical protein
VATSYQFVQLVEKLERTILSKGFFGQFRIVSYRPRIDVAAAAIQPESLLIIRHPSNAHHHEFRDVFSG